MQTLLTSSGKMYSRKMSLKQIRENELFLGKGFIHSFMYSKVISRQH